MIFTRFGNECDIEMAGAPNTSGRIPVDIIVRRDGAVSPSRKQTWADELRADGGVDEIIAAIKRAAPGWPQ